MYIIRVRTEMSSNVDIASILYNYKKSLNNIETFHLTILNTGPFCDN